VRATILVVDDNSGNRDQWRATLEAASYRVIEAGSQGEALTLLRDANSGIDLLVTGLMRNGEGAQLAVEALDVRPSLPIILAADAAHPVGIQDQFALLLTPVSDSELVGAARTLLSRHVRK
jgi:CheY-like chemotaxis protein